MAVQKLRGTKTPSVTWMILIIAVMYFAREFLIPLALAILISFLLTPVVKRFQKWGLSNVVAVLAAVFISFIVVGGVGYVVTGQVLDLANNLPKYRANIDKKIASLKHSGDGGAMKEAGETLRHLTEELNAPAEGDESNTAADAAAAKSSGARAFKGRITASSGETLDLNGPLPVEVVAQPGNAFELLRSFLGQILGPLGIAAIVIIFVIFLLIERDDLRDRVVHLIGTGHLHATTQAFDEASKRVSKYLVAQTIVNVTYGFPIGLGLYFIGIPNAPLWGLLATVLRFVPYIGPWVAAFFPVALSLLVSETWREPLLTLSLFVIIELISNNVVEPRLYGASTGLSPIAIILSAVFWTWLWGTVGLLLATPLTVCIAVLGRYIPAFAFLDILLGAKPELALHERFYQRLLANDEDGALRLAEESTAQSSLLETYDKMIVPALVLAETDAHREVFDGKQEDFIARTMRDVIASLRDQYAAARKTPVAEEGTTGMQSHEAALFLPAKDEADELVGHILAQLLWAEGHESRVVSAKSLAGEMIEEIATLRPRVICISGVPPAAVLPASYLCKRVRARFPDARIVVGVWTGEEDATRLRERLGSSTADDIVTNVRDAIAQILPLAACAPAPSEAAVANEVPVLVS